MVVENTLRYNLKSSLYVIMIGFPFGLIYCPQCINELRTVLIAGTFSSMIWLTLWKGNEMIHMYLDSKISWMEKPVKRMLWGIALMLIYTPIGMTFVNFLGNEIWGINERYLTLEGFLDYSLTAVLTTAIVMLFANARGFFLAWRQLAINEEKLKSETLSSRYESLKNQVNPHFLFNSLNVLTSLVYKDQDEAAKFIKKLSEVYRYVLDTRDQEVVNIDQELEFLNSYLFLQKMRFGDSLQISIDLGGNSGIQVPPLSLQMLVENAIKHNEVSKEMPLTIDLKMEEGEYIVVSNNLQKKNIIKKEESAKVGLSNIKARYEFLTNKPVLIEDSNGSFSVSLPVLTYNS